MHHHRPCRAAMLPTRPRAHARPGWLAENRWQGMLPYSANPRFVEPGNRHPRQHQQQDGGPPFPEPCQLRLGRYAAHPALAAPDARARRAHPRKLHRGAARYRQRTPRAPCCRWWGRNCGSPANLPPTARPNAPPAGAGLLAEWNGEMNEHLPEPLIARLAARAAGPADPRRSRPAGRRIHPSGAGVHRTRLPQHRRRRPLVRHHPVLARGNLRRPCPHRAGRAHCWLGERYGSSIESWRWGDAHQATHDHPDLGDVPVLRHLVNIRQSTSGGDFTLMRGAPAARTRTRS
jgi:penicillin G amidase